jgi:hypothetical protein
MTWRPVADSVGLEAGKADRALVQGGCYHGRHDRDRLTDAGDSAQSAGPVSPHAADPRRRRTAGLARQY